MPRVAAVGLKPFGSLFGIGCCAHHSTDARSCDSVVIVSTANDVFQNLALEDWMYHKLNWNDRPPTLLLWRNSPCVVIGRHQNPWLECRLSSIRTAAAGGVIAVARRNSGGGTVFHDMGNLNCTFFTTRAAYNRKANLELICRAIGNCWPGVNVHVSSRLDILLDGHYKVSGTASKLGRDVAYHHCTVLVDVDTSLLSRVLRSSDVTGVQSKATVSVKSPVRNLEGLRVEDVAQSIAELFANGRHRHCLPVDPTEDRFPGIDETASHLRSWDWIFGRCPSFTIERTVGRPSATISSEAEDDGVVFSASVERGVIKSASVETVSGGHVMDSLQRAVRQIVGCKFSMDSFGDRFECEFKNWVLVSCLADLV